MEDSDDDSFNDGLSNNSLNSGKSPVEIKKKKEEKPVVNKATNKKKPV